MDRSRGLTEIFNFEVGVGNPALWSEMNRQVLPRKGVLVFEAGESDCVCRQLPAARDGVTRFTRAARMFCESINPERSAIGDERDLLLDLKVFDEAFELHGYNRSDECGLNSIANRNVCDSRTVGGQCRRATDLGRRLSVYFSADVSRCATGVLQLSRVFFEGAAA